MHIAEIVSRQSVRWGRGGGQGSHYWTVSKPVAGPGANRPMAGSRALLELRRVVATRS